MFSLRVHDRNGRDAVGDQSNIVPVELITCISGCVHGKCDGEPLTCNCDDGYQGGFCNTRNYIFK